MLNFMEDNKYVQVFDRSVDNITKDWWLLADVWEVWAPVYPCGGGR